MGNNKIKDLSELSLILQDLKSQGRKIVQSHGCFDIVHIGHIKHFEAAKSQGDVLIVTVTPDRFISKGLNRPFFNEELRLENLAALEIVDYVALNKWPTAVETIKLLKPNIYAKGKEVLDNAEVDMIKIENTNLSNLSIEEEAVRSMGGKLYLTDEITFSSSKIINDIAKLISADTKIFLKDIKNNLTSKEVLNSLELLKDIKVLVIGDAILDRYIDCKEMEKTSKEAFVAYKFLNSELQAGGIFAIANHVAEFTNNVTLITAIGRNHYKFINEKLNKSINTNLLIQNETETIKKSRFIDGYNRNKLFEVYNSDNLRLSTETEQKILNYLEENLQAYGMVLVGDFGHGLMTEKIRAKLTNSNKFLAINTQLNSGNLGYNFITKYNRADFVLLNDREIRLPFQEKESDIKVPIKKLSNSLGVNKINITLGKLGSIYYQDGAYYPVPAFITEVIDTMGSGDAVLSITSLLAYKNVNPKIIPFLGNCVGSLAVRVVGNRTPIDPTELRKTVSYLMK